jgi:hypothetical protein
MRYLAVIIMAFSVIPATAAEADAIRIVNNITARHMPYGSIVAPVFAGPDSDEIVSYTRCGDSALWTGEFLASESYRYAVTKAPEALANINKALYGIKRLIEVTGNDVLARCAVPVSSPYALDIVKEESQHGIYTGTLDDQPYYWIGHTSRDQYLGIFHGLTVANDVVPNQPIRDMVSYLTTRLLNYLRSHTWCVIMPDGAISTTFLQRPDQQLSLLKLGRRVNGGRFSTVYKTMSTTLAPATIAPIAVEVRDPHNSYFKFNLDTITFYGLLASGDSTWVRIFYQKAYDVLRNTTDDHQNALFNMVDRAINGPNSSRDAATRVYLESWLKRSRRDEFVDLRGVYPSCGQEDKACQPIPIEERVHTDFLWQRSPFLLYGGGSGRIEGAGIDYSLPYWMARYYGVL